MLNFISEISPTRAALYARTSTRAQARRETSRSQLDLLRHYAAAEGLIVVDEFVDDAVPGTVRLEDRPAGSRLLAAAVERSIDLVLVQNVDRLGRSLEVVVGATGALEALGVSVRSAFEPTPDFVELAAYAEHERVKLASRISAGRDRASREGQWTNSPVPFGYEVDAKRRLVPSERLATAGGVTEADLVRSIFENVVAGASTVAEARRLNRLGVKIGRRYTNGVIFDPGRKWLPGRVHSLLTQTVYSGVRTLQSRNGPVVMHVPPLVDMELWRAATQKLRARKSPRTRSHNRWYPLRGLIRCAGCGNRFGGTSNPSSAGTFKRYYGCRGRMAAVEPDILLRCHARVLPADWLESIVLEAMPAELFDRADSMPREILVRTIGEGFRKSAEITLTFADGRLVSALCPTRV